MSIQCERPDADLGCTLSKDDPYPPYCCAILTSGGVNEEPILLLERRPPNAAVAANQLTCFGGKREDGEVPLACLLRECREELGWQPEDGSPKRVVDLYVDGDLIAWFYQASAPQCEFPLAFESGRGHGGVRVHLSELLDSTDSDAKQSDDVGCVSSSLSPWHKCVLQAWRCGERRADFVTRKRAREE
mmetsp:Transcript_64109/g.126826  ORF Transcript_64109/g.126826 Transcript_64109/m.126826 type:complete len:188 (-) Transcript_64109:4-567(-)